VKRQKVHAARAACKEFRQNWQSSELQSAEVWQWTDSALPSTDTIRSGYLRG
jgi:hypothetical protein